MRQHDWEIADWGEEHPRIGALPNSALVAVPLTKVRRVVVASPGHRCGEEKQEAGAA